MLGDDPVKGVIVPDKDIVLSLHTSPRLKAEGAVIQVSVSVIL